MKLRERFRAARRAISDGRGLDEALAELCVREPERRRVGGHGLIGMGRWMLEPVDDELAERKSR